MELVAQFQQLVALGLQEPCHRNACPLGHNLGHVIGTDFLAQQAPFTAFLWCRTLFKLLFQLGQLCIAELRGPAVVAIALGLLNLAVDLFNLGLEAANMLNLAFLVFPLLAHGALLFPEIGQFLFQLAQALAGALVAFLAQRLALDFQLHDLAVDLVQLCGQGVDFRADHGTGFVDNVNCLVRQLAVGDIAV